MPKTAESPFDRALPNNVEAERSILGAILLDNTTVNQAAELLRRDDFFLDSHRRIFDKMLSLMEQNRAIDPITLQDVLRQAGDLDLIGGPAAIGALIDGVPRFSNINEYCRIVKGKSIVRKLITVSNQIINRCFDAEDEPNILLDEAERSILAIADDRIRQGLVHVGDVAHHQLKHIEDAAHHGKLVTGIGTEFSDLDQMTSGLQRGDLIIVAARPSMGKCLVHDSEIVLHDGSVMSMAEIHKRRRARLLTLNNNWKLSITEPSAYIDDGIKPVFRVRTRLGREVESTITHPFLTVDGWRKLGELTVGAKIAVPRVIRIFGKQRMSRIQIAELARLTVGNCVNAPAGGNERTVDRWGALVETVMPAPDHEIPAVVFKLTRSSLARFLEQVFAMACDGESRTSASFSNRRIARQIQHLLIRFGIVAELRNAQTPGAAKWQIRIDHLPSIRIFRQEIARNDVGGQSDENMSDVGVGPNPADWVDSDVYWDEVVSIDFAGEKQVYDLTIDQTHNFIANDICVHNTAFCLNIAQNAALATQEHGAGAIVGVFSLEMSKEQLVQRMLCSQSRIDAHRLRTGILNKDDWRHLADGVSVLANTRIYLDDTPAISVLEMRAKCRRLKNEQRGLDLIIVDYLQLMSGRGKIESRQQEVSQISRDLKALAKEMHVPVVALSQLSRAVESRADHRPQLSDLRESGSIEQDADLVMFIYREDVYNQATEKQNIAEIIIGKQRNGPIGDVELVFLKQFTKFENKYRE